MAYQSNLLGDFWRNYRQRRVGKGNALSQNEMGGLLTPMLESNATMAREAGARDLQRTQFDRTMALNEQVRKDQQMAGIVGGVGQVAMLPLAYQAGKNLLAPTAAKTAQGMAGTTAQGAVAPAVASAPAAGEGLLTGGTASATPAMISAPAAAPTAAGSLLSASGPAAGLFAAQYATGKLAQPYMDKAGLPTAGKGWTYGGVPGAMAGATYDVGKKVFEGAKNFVSNIF